MKHETNVGTVTAIALATLFGATLMSSGACSSSPVMQVGNTAPAPVHGFNPAVYAGNGPPWACHSSAQCQPVPTCASSGTCIITETDAGVCSYVPKIGSWPNLTCNCFRGQQEFCPLPGSTAPGQLGIKKCQFDADAGLTSWGPCNAPSTVP